MQLFAFLGMPRAGGIAGEVGTRVTMIEQIETGIERRFWTHLCLYLAGIIGLATWNLRSHPENPWVLWVASVWGLVVSVHASFLSDPVAHAWLVERSLNRVNRRWRQLHQVGD